jgi:hypothetical protein
LISSGTDWPQARKTDIITAEDGDVIDNIVNDGLVTILILGKIRCPNH